MKSRMLTYIFTFVLLSGQFYSCANSSGFDDDIIKTYEVSKFSRIYLNGGYKVILEQSETPSLKIKADEEAFKYIDVNTNDETLRLEIERKRFDFEYIELYIGVPHLTELNIEGGIKLETSGYLDLANFKLVVEGGAKIEMGMKVDELLVIGEGGVSMNFRGVAEKMVARISGAGYLNADELKAKSVEVEIEGVGGGSVYATEHLKTIIEGVGKVKYKGNPIVVKEVEGLGLVSSD